MSISPQTFTGVSTFSEDFRSILTRATSIASLPITALQNQQKDLLQQKLLVSNLSVSVASLATSISTLGTIGEQKALVATSSNASKVTATNVGSSAPALYTISEITSVARAAAETSVTGYTDATSAPVSSTGLVKLKVGSNEYNIDIASANTLTGLRNAINGSNAGVTATILTTGTGATPYYLSITANATGEKLLELRDDPTGANTNLLTTANQGANSVFKLNGAPITKSTTFINDVVPGVTFNILGTTDVGETVDVSIAPSRASISSALGSFVSNYNTLRSQLNDQIGEAAGLLSGDFLVREIQSRLRDITSFEGTGDIRGLANLGVEFDSSGVATLNQTTFNALTNSQIDDAVDFLGSTTTGFGALASRLTSISDSVTGLAKIQLDKYEETEDRLSGQITVLTERVTDLQRSLTAKLQIADSLLAGLQSQQTVLDASLKSLALTLFGRQEQ